MLLIYFRNVLCKFRFIEQNRKTRINLTVVTTPNSYYVFTTIDGINLPYFSPFRILVTEFGVINPSHIFCKLRYDEYTLHRRHSGYGLGAVFLRFFVIFCRHCELI